MESAAAMKTRSNRLTDLGELQLDVLDRLCRLGEGTVYDVLDQFPRRRRPRYTTVLTVLRGLEQKGLVTHSTQDRAYVFRPTSDAAQVRGRLLRDVVERVFNGSPRDLVAALMDVDGITPDVLDELKSLIAAKEAAGDSK
jgi:predicted transcriptional regulator